MQTLCRIGVLGTLFLLILIPFGHAVAQEITLESLVHEVKVALLKVEQEVKLENLPPLDTAVLVVNATQKKSATGRVSLHIVEVGGDSASSITHKIELTLSPPSAESSSDVSPLKLADALASSILAGSMAIAEAKKGSPPLIAKTLKASVKFALTRSGGGGVGIHFPPFSFSGKAKVSSANVQSITVTYKVK